MANIANLERKEQMFSLVEQWHNSSQSQKFFCKEHNINVHTFNYWVKKYRLSSSFADFIELKPKIKSQKNEQIIKFHFSGEISAEVPAELAIDFMNQLIVR